MTDHDHKSHEPDPTFRKEQLSPDDQYSGGHRINTPRVNSMDVQSSAGQISKPSSSSLSNENPSSTIVSTHSSDSVLHVPSKNDISSKLGPLVQRESSMLDAVKSEERQKHMTESSCSNSIQITLPVSSSNECYLEIPTDMSSAKPHTVGVNNSISESFGSSMAGPVTQGTVSDIAAQSSKGVVDNSREGNALKVSGLVRKQNELLSDGAKKSISNLPKQRSENGEVQLKQQFDKVGRAFETARKGAEGSIEEISMCSAASGSIALSKESNRPAVYANFVHFGNSGQSSCLTETEEPAPTFSRKREGLSSSYLDIVDQELMKQQSFSNLQPPLKVPQPLGLCEINGLNNGDESTKLISALSSDFAAKGHLANPDRFDLNEDKQNLNSHVQSTCEAGNHFNVIRVVAKPGVPPSIPMPHRKLEGEMSWKGFAATSAFRPTNSNVQASPSDCTPTFSKGFSGIDLNVAAEDDDKYELHLGVGTSAPLILNPALKVGCSKAERLDFDLNCLGDITDMSQVASLPATSVKTEIVDFNLNEGFSTVDKRDDCRWQNKPSQHIAKLPSNSPGVYIPTNSGGHSFDLTRPAYRTDFDNIQFYNQFQMQSFLMGSSNAVRPAGQYQKVDQLEPKLPFVIPSLPPQSYPSSGPFFICPNGLVPSNLQYHIPMQHARDPRVHAAIPQNITQTMVSSVAGGRPPRLMQVFDGRSQTEVANIRPCMDVVNGGIPALNGSPRDTRQFFPPSKCSPVKEQMRVPMKRPVPEGGHETLQLCTRQLTSWN